MSDHRLTPLISRGFVAAAVVATAAVVGAGALMDRTAGTAGGAPPRFTLASYACKDGVRRPRKLVFTCADHNSYADGLRWSTWGGRVAVGRGTHHYNDCNPACAGGTFRHVPITVRLYTRRSCPGRNNRYYQRATLVRVDGERERAYVGCPI